MGHKKENTQFVNIALNVYVAICQGVKLKFETQETGEIVTFNPVSSTTTGTFYENLKEKIKSDTTGDIGEAFLRDFLHQHENHDENCPKSNGKIRYASCKFHHEITAKFKESNLDALCYYVFKKSFAEWHFEFLDNSENLKSESKISLIDEQKEDPLSNYYEYLASFYTSKVLGEEELTLKDLYVEPNGKRKISPSIFPESDYHLVPLISEIRNWVNLKWIKTNNPNAERQHKLSLVLGYAGQGKTSLCYRLLYDLINIDKKKVLFFRMRDIDERDFDNLIFNPFTTIINILNKRSYFLTETEKEFSITINEDILRNSILILDGLDELVDTHSLEKNKIVMAFFNELDKYTSPERLIITSRYELDIYQLESQKIKIDRIEELNIEEQWKWVCNYNSKVEEHKKYQITKYILEKINQKSQLKPFVSQPILIHLLAKLQLYDLDKYNSAQIYNMLFDNLIERYWVNFEYEEAEHPNLPFSDKNQIRELLRSVGFKMMQENSSVLNYQKLNQIIQDQHGQELDKLTAKNFKKLLLAFYFNENGDRKQIEKYSIEFLHKTFGEYFAAEYIWEYLKNMSEKFIHSYDDEEYDKYNDMLLHIFSKVPFSMEVTDFLSDIIKNELSEIKNDVLVLVNYTHLDRLFEDWQFKRTYKENQNLANNFFSTFLRLSKITKKKSSVITNKKGILKLSFESFVSDKLIFLVESTNSILYFPEIDLCGCNLEGVTWSGIVLKGSDLRFCNFERAKLVNGEFSSINGIKTNLKRANFCRANLSGSMFFETLLRKTNFNYADLSEVTFSCSDLRASTFENSNIDNTAFYDCLLEHTKGLNYENLSRTKTLYGCKGLEKKLEKRLRADFPFLFDEDFFAEGHDNPTLKLKRSSIG